MRDCSYCGKPTENRMLCDLCYRGRDPHGRLSDMPERHTEATLGNSLLAARAARKAREDALVANPALVYSSKFLPQEELRALVPSANGSAE